MASDGASLQAMAQRLRASAAILGDQPAYRANASPLSLSGQAALLRADGQAAVDHGRLMVDQAAFMAVIAGKLGSTIITQDVALMASDATRIDWVVRRYAFRSPGMFGYDVPRRAD